VERKTRAIVACFAAAKVLLHAFSITRYGWFRDELYYIACSERLAFGYVDHPPFSIVVLRVMRALLGDSLVAIRVTPLTCGVLQIVLSGVLAHRLGARTLGVGLACAATLGAPLSMAFSHHYSMNAIDGVLWTVAVLLLHAALTKARTRDWVVLGVVLGAGLMNKASVLWLGAGIALALASFHRDTLRTRGPWIAAAIALAIFLPNVVWQMRNHWPTIEFAKNALAGKYRPLSRLDFVKEVALQAGPAGALSFALALVVPFVSPSAKPHRWLSIVLAAVAAILLLQRASKPEYLGAAFPSAFALGASVIDRWATTRTRAVAATTPWGLLLAAYATVVAPFAIPLLPVERFVRYQSALGMKPQTSEKKELGRLPQYYADMFGWPELAAAVERVTMSLSPDERAHAVIFSATGGYGPASAIEFFNRGHDLPRVVCGHNNWWLWGYGDGTATNAIVVGGDREDIAAVFDSVELATTFECGDCLPSENHKPIWIARRLRVPMATLWPKVKHYE
jgi:hypothetical protein